MPYIKYTNFINGKTEFTNNDTGEVFMPSEFKELSKATVRNYLSKWESSIATDQYSLSDYKELLDTLSNIKGKILLSSYPSETLDEYVHKRGWHIKFFDMR